MLERIERAFAGADLELRGSDGRTVAGIAVPYGEPAEIGAGVVEVFRHGAFARTIAERGPAKVKLLALHDQRSMPLGRASVLREEARGLYLEGRVSQTQAGDEALELIRDGALDAFSIGFSPVRDRWNPQRTEVERLEVRLAEVSVVAFPAYEGARILAVRDEMPRPDPNYDADLLGRRLKIRHFDRRTATS